MRRYVERAVAAAAAAGVMLSGAAAAAPCLRPADVATFEMAALKSEMMVVATGCRAEARYDAAVRRFRPEMASRDRALLDYFRRAGGRMGQSRNDDYVTQLANARSQAQADDVADGDACARGMALFDEIDALRTGADLARLAARKAYPQPYRMTACDGRAFAVQGHDAHRPVVRYDARPPARPAAPSFDALPAPPRTFPAFDPARFR